jgi:hypothetical protein
MLPLVARVMPYRYDSQWFGNDKVDTVRLIIAERPLQELGFGREVVWCPEVT